MGITLASDAAKVHELAAQDLEKNVAQPGPAGGNSHRLSEAIRANLLVLNMVKTVRAKRLALFLFVLCAFVRAAAAQPPPAAPAATPVADEGIPVQSELVKSKCGGCHKIDDKGRMTRISYRRASPENWEKTIKRMVSLNNVRLEPAEG